MVTGLLSPGGCIEAVVVIKIAHAPTHAGTHAFGNVVCLVVKRLARVLA